MSGWILLVACTNGPSKDDAPPPASVSGETGLQPGTEEVPDLTGEWSGNCEPSNPNVSGYAEMALAIDAIEADGFVGETRVIYFIKLKPGIPEVPLYEFEGPVEIDFGAPTSITFDLNVDELLTLTFDGMLEAHIPAIAGTLASTDVSGYPAYATHTCTLVPQ